MGGPIDVPGNQLRAIVERIEQVEDEIKDLTEAKKEIYAEAKSNGFDVRVLREVIRVRKQDQKERDEHETLLDIYMSAIKGASAEAKAA
jgi:uncharacterized protein (UPF0335 family)